MNQLNLTLPVGLISLPNHQLFFLLSFLFLKQSEANALKTIVSLFSSVSNVQITLDSALRPAVPKNGSKLMGKPTHSTRDLKLSYSALRPACLLCRNNAAAEHGERALWHPVAFSQDWSKIPFHRAKDNLESLPHFSAQIQSSCWWAWGSFREKKIIFSGRVIMLDGLCHFPKRNHSNYMPLLLTNLCVI